MTPASLLAAALDANPSRPLFTFYDDATGERVELSVASFENWVAKTANLLRNGLDAQPGERIAVRLPAHWQGAVWMLAAWSAGLVVTDRLDGLDLLVCGPEPITDTDARDVIALSLRPRGAPFAEPLPPGVIDYGAEVLSHDDRFVPYAPLTADDPAMDEAGVTRTAGDLVAAATERAAVLGLESGVRLLTTANPAAPDGYLDAVLVPLAIDASVVLVRNPDPAKRASRRTEERVTHEL